MSFIQIVTYLTLMFYMAIDYKLRIESGEFKRSFKEEVETFVALFIIGFTLFFILISPFYLVYLLWK